MCIMIKPGWVVQSVTCLNEDPGVASLIPARSHTFLEIDHEIISAAILLLSANSRADLDTHADHSTLEGLL